MYVFKRWIHRLFNFRARKPVRVRSRRTRLSLEWLEDRLAPSNVTSISFSNPANQYTNAASVVYAVAFNTAPSSVVAADFDVVTSDAVQATSPVVVGGSSTSFIDQAPPTVTMQPGNKTVNAGANTTFTAAASGSPTPTVHWKVSTNGGTSFTALSAGGAYSGVTKKTLTITGATAAMNGDEYEAVFTNTFGTATTSAATLTVHFAPTVATQPKNQTVTAGSNATFTAAVSANPAPSIQWEVSTNGGTTFTAISNGSVYSGVNTDTLTVKAATLAMSGDEYEAVFTNSLGSVTTMPATLTVT